MAREGNGILIFSSFLYALLIFLSIRQSTHKPVLLQYVLMCQKKQKKVVINISVEVTEVEVVSATEIFTPEYNTIQSTQHCLL